MTDDVGTGDAMNEALPELLGIRARFDHVAHAAPRIRDLLPLYCDVLGGTFYSGGPNDRVGYFAVQLDFPGGGRTELMEPLEGSSFLDSFFARQPQGGLHHVMYYVDSLDLAIAAARDAGIDVVGEWRGLDEYQEAFLHPKSNHGVLLQLVEIDVAFHMVGWDSTLDEVLKQVRP